ncbi:XRE family transcriptional regulator [Rossellomorea vietnamensis]|uniref:helix-turn-helix domain-containing protein n=1 Tax=Rossellomorea vietnamensis TaxID=218284 RepID=UPI001CCEB8F6|nr:XRE family transcriptional regulator [Rossellomorea vietnamensis]MCA0150305.1 XRE family transcriptional regulator [Rossellomorea vietnamensis]
MNLRQQKNNYCGQKLKTARISNGYTLEELGGKLNISHQSVSKYEMGKAVPDIETQKKIAEILGYSTTFFYGNEENLQIPQGAHFFRSGAAVAKKYKDQVQEKVKTIAYLIDYLESVLKLPPFKLDALFATETQFRQVNLNEIDDMAEKLRRFLGLGDGPITNLTALCERLGIIVFSTVLDNEKIDACTVFYKNRPYILLNKDRISSVRLRFNIAHELGHIILHSGYSEKDVKDKSKHKRIELEANRFASSFLMPEAGIVPELSSSGLDYLIILKEHWKTSIQSIVYRAEELGIFTADYALYLRQQISRKKWRKKEPLDDVLSIEEPKLISQAIRLLTTKYKKSLDEISFNTGITVAELSNIAGIGLTKEETLQYSKNYDNVVYISSHPNRNK